jgi:hypothetical protein
MMRARLGRGGLGFFILPSAPLGSLLPSDLAQCDIELPLLALLRVLLGPSPWRAARHWSAVIGKHRFELFTQLTLGQLRRLRHSGPFEKLAHAVRTKKGLGVSRGRPEGK